MTSVARSSPIARSDAAASELAVALTTDDDDPGLGVPHLWDAVGAGRVEAPLEHRAVDDESVGQLSLSGSLRGRAGVDEQGAGADLVPSLVRGQAHQVGPGAGQVLVDAAHRTCMTCSPRGTSSPITVAPGISPATSRPPLV